MNRIVFFAMLLMVVGQAQGQDTISVPPDNYLSNWPDLKNDSIAADCFDKRVKLYMLPYRDYENAQGFYSATPVVVHGIAAALRMKGNPIDGMSRTIAPYHQYVDTSLEASYEFLRLYRRNGDDMDVLAEAAVHASDTHVCWFWIEPEHPHPYDAGSNTGPTRVFEVYFDQPVTVVDTFYAGITDLMDQPVSNDGQGNIFYPSWPMYATVIEQTRDGSEPGCFPGSFSAFMGMGSWCFRYAPLFGGYGNLLFVLPIFTPDTSATASVAEVQGAGRYVNLLPNPAKGHVTVTSSFGMNNIEAYDAMGRLLLDLPVSGIVEELDIRSWPEGLCLVIVDTPMGRVSKKLLVEK